MYPDGPGCLYELLQNADDAGASEITILWDMATYGTHSLLKPEMEHWQGPALVIHNNSIFKEVRPDLSSMPNMCLNLPNIHANHRARGFQFFEATFVQD